MRRTMPTPTAHGHGARAQPGRARPREPADHDLAADRAGDPDDHHRLALAHPAAVRAGPGADAGLRPADPRDRAGLGALAGDGGLDPHRHRGDRRGGRLLLALAAATTRSTPCTGSAASTSSWSTSGTSTSCTTPLFVRPTLALARAVERVRPPGDRRRRQRLGVPHRAPEPAGGGLRPPRRRLGWSTRSPASSTSPATGAAASRPAGSATT